MATGDVGGLDDVLANLSREVRRIKGRTHAGMQEAGAFIKGEALEMTPAKTGTLRGSAFYSTDVTVDGPRLRVGYTALYAPFVHEFPAEYNYTVPGTGPKFLQRAITENASDVLSIVRDAARIL